MTETDVEANATYAHSRAPVIIVDQKPSSIFEGDHVEDLRSFSDILTRPEFASLKNDAGIDLAIRYKDEWKAMKKEIKDPIKIEQTREKIIQTLTLYNFSSRLANTMLISITDSEFGKDKNTTNEFPQDGLKFGSLVRAALTSVAAFPHGEIHTRNIDGAQKLATILAASDLNDPSGIFTVAAGLKPIFHDFPQAIMEYKKSIQKNNPTIAMLNPKDDHKEVAAAFVVMLRPHFQKFGYMTEDLSRELVTLLAADISAHDDLSGFDQSLSGVDKSRASDLPDEDLYREYIAGTVDRLSILPAQWLSIVHQKQLEMKKYYDEKFNTATFDLSEFGHFGLGKELENLFKNEILSMENDTRSIFSEQTTTEYFQYHETLVAFASLFNIQDTKEMVIPGEISYTRKINVPVGEFVPLSALALDREQASWLKHPKNFNVSIYMRQTAEQIAFARMIMRSPFQENKLFVKFMSNELLYHMAQAQNFFMKLIEGEQGMDILDDVSVKRLRVLGEKVLKKGGADTIEEKALMMEAMPMASDIIAYVNTQLPKTIAGIEYSIRFNDRIVHLQEQVNRTRELLRRKKGPRGEANDNLIYKYSPEDRAYIEQTFTSHWNEVCVILGITDKKTQDKMRTDMRSDRSFKSLMQEYPMPHTPGYDPTGKLSDAKVNDEQNPAVVRIRQRARQQEFVNYKQELEDENENQ